MFIDFLGVVWVFWGSGVIYLFIYCPVNIHEIIAMAPLSFLILVISTFSLFFLDEPGYRFIDFIDLFRNLPLIWMLFLYYFFNHTDFGCNVYFLSYACFRLELLFFL